MNTESPTNSLPPYVPYSSFTNFINGLGEHALPTHIDKSLMSKMSGSGQSAMIAALKSLNLIDSQSEPSDYLKRYVVADADTKKILLGEIVKNAYKFLFEDFNLAQATSKKVEDKFREAGASGSTLTKCISFFLAASKEAGIFVSPYVKAPALARSNGSPKKKKSPTADTSSNPLEKEKDREDTPKEGMTRFDIPLKDTENGIIYLPEGLTEAQAIKAVKMANFILKSYYEIDED